MSSTSGKPQGEKQPIEIELFDKFVNTFIIKKKSLINNEKTFNVENIDPCLNKLNSLTRMNKSTDDDKSSLETVFEKETDTSSDTYELLWHCYYIMYMMGGTAKTFFKKTVNNDIFVEKGKGVASTNQAYNKEAIRPFKTLLYIFKYLWKNNTDSHNVKKQIINLLPKTQEKQVVCKSLECNPGDFDFRIRNILLYLCAPNSYVPIVSQNHKDKIWKNLCFLINESYYNENSFMNIINSIKGINNLNIVNKDKESDNLNVFYHKSIRPFWDTPEMSTKSDRDGNLSTDTLLKYKKAIVLYGPPGTSKTFTARELSKTMIATEFAKKLKESSDKTNDLQNFIANEDVIYGDNKDNKDNKDSKDVLPHIHRLQLHPSYTYEDFIIGKTITVDTSGLAKVDTQKGYLLRLLDKIENEKGVYKDLPHIVILDEINRVDISRIFGELFTAMEPSYRKEGVDLPLSQNENEVTKLKIPENLYFIGTMNQIDFSLEQVDFALRRRFAWIESTFDKERLKDIINEKESIDGLKVEEYIQSCEAVNIKISEESTLGPEYKIGHTFFSEIVDIKKEADIDDWGKARDFLWDISIMPMIDAYCGSMDASGKKSFIEKCKKAFMPESKGGKPQRDKDSTDNTTKA